MCSVAKTPYPRDLEPPRDDRVVNKPGKKLGFIGLRGRDSRPDDPGSVCMPPGARPMAGNVDAVSGKPLPGNWLLSPFRVRQGRRINKIALIGFQ